jgi:AcrR family transcriptional regulator
MIEVAVDTKTKILDSAEKLFGKKGFDATSLRDITAEADVNLAAVNYHFQTKESLIDAVIARRLEPVNRRRLEMLAAAGPNATVEQLVEAFVLPVVQQDISSILPMMGRAFASPDPFLLRIFKRNLIPIADRFCEAFMVALPQLSPEECRWRLLFAAGSMAQTLSWSQLVGEITRGVCDATDREAVTDRLVRFVAAGFRANESSEGHA